MATAAGDRPRTFADLHERLGWVPLRRIRMDPPPGTATEADLLRVTEGVFGVPCELVDGVLVEMAVGTRESQLAMLIGRSLLNFVEPDDLGVVLGERGGLRMFRGNVRFPDVSFISWEAIGSDELPQDAYWPVPPTLAVEVLSPDNTVAEIDRKLAEFFRSGCKLAWVIDKDTLSATAYTSPAKGRHLGPGDVLDGGRVLPGFRLPLADLFASNKRRKKGKPK